MIRRGVGSVSRELGRPGSRRRELGAWYSPITRVAGKVAKVATTGAKTVAKGATAVGKGAKKAATTAAGGVAKVGRKFSPPWEGVGFDKGWATRLAQRLVNVGFTPDAIICNTKKYRNSGFCKARGKIAWSLSKQLLEKAYGLPPGTIDKIEGELNQVGNDPAAREAKAKQIAAQRNVPLDALMPVVIQPVDPPWWRQVLESVGLG